MRHAPSLTFVADDVPENARHVEEVLARAKALDEEAAARRVESYAGEPDPYKKPREDDEDGRVEGVDVMPSTDPDA
jgi:ribosome-binding factor A